MDEKRKFENPTAGWVGAVVLDDDNKPKGMPVEPGGHIWLSRAEERLTAEAPRLAENNPFTKQWRRPTEWNGSGEAISFEEMTGVLVLSDEPARTILSDRFTPSTALEAERPAEKPAEEETGAGQDGETEEIIGTPPIPQQPPVEGKPAPDEHVATPEAVAANDEHLARRAEIEALSPEDLGGLIGRSAHGSTDHGIAVQVLAERQAQSDTERGSGELTADGDDSPTAIGDEGPKGQEEIGVQRGEALV